MRDILPLQSHFLWRTQRATEPLGNFHILSQISLLSAFGEILFAAVWLNMITPALLWLLCFERQKKEAGLTFQNYKDLKIMVSLGL